MQLNKKILFILSLVTLFGFSAIGFLAIYIFQDLGVKEFFAQGISWQKQIVRGIAFGASAALGALVIIQTDWFKPSRIFFTGIIASLNPSFAHVLFYSFCAGVGEEILFRGAIQPHIGIWLTSILFIFLHGYLNPFNWPITFYGLFMVLISSGLGYLFKIYGIYAAMTAHFIFDVAMFSFLKWNIRRE